MSTTARLYEDIRLFTNRDDLDSNTIMPRFVRLAEAQLNRDIRHWRMENRAYYPTSDRYVARPEDWLETIRLTIEGEWHELEPISTSDMARRRGIADDAVGTPRYFRHSENAIELFPTPAEEVQLNLEYYQKIPALTLTDAVLPGDTIIETNWLLQEHYDLVLYCCLMHAAQYLMDQDMLGQYTPMYAAIAQQVNGESRKSMTAAAGRRLRPRGLAGHRSNVRR